MFKKGLGILFALSILFLLGACGSDVETSEFELEENGVVMLMTYHHEGDEVIKQTAENTIPYTSLGVESEDEAKQFLEPQSEQMQGIDGLKEEIEYGDSEAKETVEVDYEELDMDQAKDVPGLMLDGDIENGISMEKTAEMLINQGFEEKE